MCTTELGRTAALKDEFAKRNTKAMALSIDPIEEHYKWAPDIGEVTGTALNFPIVADPDRRVAELYDMIHPGAGDTSTVRSVFIVDPDNELRLMLTYPSRWAATLTRSSASSMPSRRRYPLSHFWWLAERIIVRRPPRRGA